MVSYAHQRDTRAGHKQQQDRKRKRQAPRGRYDNACTYVQEAGGGDAAPHYTFLEAATFRAYVYTRPRECYLGLRSTVKAGLTIGRCSRTGHGGCGSGFGSNPASSFVGVIDVVGVSRFALASTPACHKTDTVAGGKDNAFLCRLSSTGQRGVGCPSMCVAQGVHNATLKLAIELFTHSGVTSTIERFIPRRPEGERQLLTDEGGHDACIHAFTAKWNTSTARRWTQMKTGRLRQTILLLEAYEIKRHAASRCFNAPGANSILS